MALETDADRAALLDPDEAAVIVTVTPVAGPPRSFAAIVDGPAFIADLSDGLRATTSSPQLFGLQSDLESVLADDTITIPPSSPMAGVYRRGEPALPDGTGFATLALVRPWP